MSRKWKTIIGIDVVYLLWVIWIFGEDATKSWGNAFWALFGLFVIGIWPLWKWRRYWVRRKEPSLGGWCADDKVIVDGKRGVLEARPPKSRYKLEPAEDTWLVRFEDGTEEELRESRLKLRGVVDLLGDLVRMVTHRA